LYLVAPKSLNFSPYRDKIIIRAFSDAICVNINFL
jgi:hypothetical protein